ncbi:Uncharacterised protein [Candidatus Bilamarchaeum dharawalense]|uniref:Uncharacterized protein n=1 Tax=Candidatus Bilamarchaeum dharawalense TaxID=2885759 RepID=A0A5E4LPM9_9ARCH|nr:Uncharacterised protein [Candidatus Bilamarchaeum dharawalense]
MVKKKKPKPKRPIKKMPKKTKIEERPTVDYMGPIPQ